MPGLPGLGQLPGPARRGTLNASPVAHQSPPRVLALGDAAWTVSFGDRIDPELQALVSGLQAHIEQLRVVDATLGGVVDLVPTFCALTVHFDPWLLDATQLGRRLQEMATRAQPRTTGSRCWQLPVCFDEDLAPDLARVCELRQLTRAEVIRQFLDASFRVYMLGFQPGFPYMGGLPPALLTPRLPSPRQKVPAQSVAIALDMCSVYPWESPGGWNLLGRTPVVLFDPSQAERPAMLTAGDEVRWTAVDRSTHDRLAADIARGLPRETFLQDSAT